MPTVKILSVLPVLGQPRDSKRISTLIELGFDVSVSAFERNYHKGRLPECRVQSLGKIEHGKYLRRLLSLSKALPILRTELRNADVVYASGPDMAFMAMIAGTGLRRPIMLEIGDIREIQVKTGIIGMLIRKIDSFLTQRCAVLIVTAPDFYTEYYNKWLGISMPHLVLENKIEAKENRNAELEGESKHPSKIIIGYFGLLRCQWTWEILQKLSESNKFEVVVAGYALVPADIAEQAKNIENIRYIGEYKSPEDLPTLYGSVDIVWACYQYIKEDDWNLKWARTNRFYESCFYQKPIIARNGSNDGNQVDKLNIGLTLKHQHKSDVITELQAISRTSIETWTSNIRRLDPKHFVYSEDELSNLKKLILEASAKKNLNN